MRSLFFGLIAFETPGTGYRKQPDKSVTRPVSKLSIKRGQSDHRFQSAKRGCVEAKGKTVDVGEVAHD